MRRIGQFFAIMALVAGFGALARADTPGQHPYYIHALSDLRAVRWMLAHQPGDVLVSAHQNVAIGQIDIAIGDMKVAAIDDGKNLNDHPPVDLPGVYAGRLHKALDLLGMVRGEINREEDDPAARGLKRRAIGHVDYAIREVRAAIFDAEHHR